MSRPRWARSLTDAGAPPSDVHELVTWLRARGERLTRPRLAVLRALHERPDDHLTAEGLLDEARRADADLAESSLYRALEWLEGVGVVAHTHFGHGPATWHLASDQRLHLVCERCGLVTHCADGLLDAGLRRVTEVHGFVLDLQHFALPGRCAACRG